MAGDVSHDADVAMVADGEEFMEVARHLSVRFINVRHDKIVIDDAPWRKHEFLDLPREFEVFVDAVFQGGDFQLGVRHFQNAIDHHEQVHLLEALVHVVGIPV